MICCQRLSTSIWGVHDGWGASNKVVFLDWTFCQLKIYARKMTGRGSLILSLRSQNLYSVLSLNSSSRFRTVGKLSLAIPGCVMLVTIFINSFSLGSGSISSIILVIVELLNSFSRPRLFRSICNLSITLFYHLKHSFRVCIYTPFQLFYFWHYNIHQLALISILLINLLLYLFDIFS